jgi:hypothetical protein
LLPLAEMACFRDDVLFGSGFAGLGRHENILYGRLKGVLTYIKRGAQHEKARAESRLSPGAIHATCCRRSMIKIFVGEMPK